MSDAAQAKSRGFADDPDFAAEVAAGLGRPQKRLEPKYFYDEEGSRLFDRICELDEYYPTRTETRILRDNAYRISEILSARSALVEFGSGSSVKTRLLLGALPEITTYVPLDISGEHLGAAGSRIAADYPEIAVRPETFNRHSTMKCPEGSGRAKLLQGRARRRRCRRGSRHARRPTGPECGR